MPQVNVRARMWERDGRWWGRLERGQAQVSAPTRRRCLDALRRAAGPGATLTVELVPPLAGVAEAAAILGWDKRRVSTYVRRGSFPEPVARLASGRVWRREDLEAFGVTRRTRGAPRRGA